MLVMGDLPALSAVAGATAATPSVATTAVARAAIFIFV
jgi:hypothetical protein